MLLYPGIVRRMTVSILIFRYLGVLGFLLSFLLSGRGAHPANPLNEDGKLIVLVTWADSYSTPATNVYVEAHGYVPKYSSVKSFVLKSSLPGRYETSLPPGVYDVFVSDDISVPSCKRVLIKTGSTTSWALQPELDRVYIEK
jgi:hypothetical protein